MKKEGENETTERTTIQLRTSNILKEKLQDLAKKRGLNLTNLILYTMMDELKKEEEKEKKTNKNLY